MRKAWKSGEVAEGWGVGGTESDGSDDCPIGGLVRLGREVYAELLV